MRAVSLHVTGVVQGVGFRPFVYNLAVRLGVTGWVKNTSDGVFAHAEGTPEAVDAFVRAISAEAPPMAVVTGAHAHDVSPEGYAAFEIRASEAVEGTMTLVSPDIATCPACAAEMKDPNDRRFGYPFTNCTNCGPRFTIIEDVPYDRPMTTMRDFPLCDECAAEYADPANRRFHAQPNACFRCGPRLYLNVVGEGGNGGGPALGQSGSGGGPALKQSSPGALGAFGRSSAPSAPSPAAELAADPLRTHLSASLGSPPVGVPCSDSPAQGPSVPSPLRADGTSPACGTAPITPTGGLPDDAAWTPEREVVPRPHRDPALERIRARALVEETARLLRAGSIVAVKGLGGFQLACDATSEAAVTRLRERKHRWGKPLAIMVPSLDAARVYCDVSPEEETLLASPAAPIVLLALKRAGNSLAPSLAPGLIELGVMLPYTPLHHLLLEAFGGPLVMTSGNRSEEPIATGNAEALARLADIADVFLMHDRDIYSRYDDSVLRVTPGVGTEYFRRARGFAPFPLTAPIAADEAILACGSEQKNTFCLLTGSHAFVSQHIGDMENAETLETYERTAALYERLFRVRPAVVAYDLHPEYLSTKYALGLALPAEGVQHHHAHIASVLAEHGVQTRALGVALDGTGYGTDGTIWGGEWLAADLASFDRVAHLRQLPLPGGAAAIRRPARMALGALAECGLLENPGTRALRARLSEGEERTVLAMIAHGLNTPRTSSMGRLFDAVASLAGVRDDALYEGQAAIELEALADHSAAGAYAFGVLDGADGSLVVDSAPVLEAVLDDLAAGVPAGVISMRFHRAVIAAVASVAAQMAGQLGLRQVALSGGVFLNRIVLAGSVAALSEAGLEPLTPRKLPANDGGISFGQAVVAAARQRRG